MLVDFRPHARLLGKDPVDLAAAVTPVLEALAQAQAGSAAGDLSRVRVLCDWVQYRENFRDVIDVRPVLARLGGIGGSGPEPVLAGVAAYDREIAVDVRRSGLVPLRELTAARLRDGSVGHVFLEEWGPGSRSCIWDFNALYWSALEL